jgi:acetyltransferase
LTDETTRELQDVLPDAASVVNPVDVAGGTDDDQRVFVECARAILSDPNVDVLLLTGLFGGYGIRFAEQYTDVEIDAAGELGELVATSETPIIVQSAYEGFDPVPHDVLREAGIPVVESLDVAAASISSLVTYGRHRRRAEETGDFELPTDYAESVDGEDGRTTQLSEVAAKRALDAASLPVTPFELAETPEGASAAASTFEGPVAMKIVSPDIVHKSDAGGVALDVEGPEAVERTYDDLLEAATRFDPNANIDGILVSPMREEAVELIVGVIHDEQFGPVAMVGLGGVFVEVLEDVAFRALPLTEADARAMLEGIDAEELLDGARGNPSVDRDALVDLLCSVSAFVEANPSIAEIDLNPVFADEDGVEIVDASISVRGESELLPDERAVTLRGENDD